MGSLAPRERGDLGENTQPKHAIANCCCYLANANEKLFRFSLNYFGLVTFIISFSVAVVATIM